MSDPTERAIMSEAAPLIREHLWLGKTPPPSPDGRPWSMGRDLNIWKRLVHKHGVDPLELNGAIEVVRLIRSDDWVPWRMTVFYWRRDGEFKGTVFLNECIAYARSRAASLQPKENPMNAIREILRG